MIDREAEGCNKQTSTYHDHFAQEEKYMDLSAEEMRRILDVTHGAVIAAIDLFKNEEGWKDRRGGYLCVANPDTGQPILQARIGEPPNEKWKKYFDLSSEKAQWLGTHPGTRSSFQGRALPDGRPGGAIRTPNWILSFSGLPEQGNEAVMLTAAIRLGYLTYRDNDRTIRQITSGSDNRYARRLISRFCFSELHASLNSQ